MAVAGTRAKRFLQPGGANAVFARKRGMVAPPPLKETRQASKPKSRFGKASGQDYADFFSNPRNVNAIRSSIASLKNILVEGFIAAKSLRTTVGNMIKQIQSTGSGGGGGGLGGFFSGILGTIGKTALVAAVVAGVAKLFGPKLGEIFGGIKQSLNNTFESIKTNLTNLDNKIEQVYNYIVSLHNGTLKTLIDSYNGVLQFLANRTGRTFTKVPSLKPMKDYREQFGDKGVNFLSGVTLGGIRDDITSSLTSGLTGTADFLTGGLYSNVTGFVGDLLNNFFASLGITDSVNELAKSFGMGSPFGASRQLSNPLEGLGISGTGIGSALTGALGSLGNAFGNPAAAATLPTSTSANVPDVSNDPEFIKEVQKLAQETGTKPSELMALYNAESGGLDPRSTNKSGATGIFQLMYGGKFGDVRYGKTREEFKNLSRAEQVKIHKKYLEDAGFFRKGGSGIADVKMANIAPAYLGKGLDDPIYSAPSPEYEGNKNIDLLFGNKDGVITLREYQNFVNETGGASGFAQYDQNISSLLQPVAPSMKVASKKSGGGVTVINAGGADGQKVASAKPADVSPENTGAGGSPSYKHFPSSSPDKFAIPGLAYGVYEA